MLHHDPSALSQASESASLSFADSHASSATELSLPRRIAAAVAANPDAIALTASCGTLTYGELERQATQLAAHLAWAGIGRESVVAIALARSFDRIVAQL